MSYASSRRPIVCTALAALALATSMSFTPRYVVHAAISRSVPLPPLPTRAVVVCSDISASVPLSLGVSTKHLVTRSLNHAYATPDQSIPDTLVEWDKIGMDSYSPQDVLVRGWIRGVHGEPTNPFLSLRVRHQIDAEIADERRSATHALHTVIGAINRITLHTEWATDLNGCFDRFQADTSFISGPRTLIVSSDLIGAAPESTWNLRNTTVDVFQYCSRTSDDPAHCGQRRNVWDAAFRQAGATDHWYSSDNLDTLPFIAF